MKLCSENLLFDTQNDVLFVLVFKTAQCNIHTICYSKDEPTAMHSPSWHSPMMIASPETKKAHLVPSGNTPPSSRQTHSSRHKRLHHRPGLLRPCRTVAWLKPSRTSSPFAEPWRARSTRQNPSASSVAADRPAPRGRPAGAPDLPGRA